MQDDGGPEGLPIRSKMGYCQNHYSDSDGKQNQIYPGPPCRNQETHQYAPENPGDEQCDDQGDTHLLPTGLFSRNLINVTVNIHYLSGALIMRNKRVEKQIHMILELIAVYPFLSLMADAFPYQPTIAQDSG